MSKNSKIVLQILSDGKYHSGEDLGNKLKLTRSAIWKIIKQLQDQEINIEAKTNLGYRIPDGIELLDEKLITQYIDAKYNKEIKNKITIFDELPSTNDYLAAIISAKNNKKINICFAEHQIAGKGRLGRQWISPFAKNIYMSLLWQFTRAPHELASLGLVVAVAITEALKKTGIEDGITLKWPNDVLWNGCKLAGILIELFGETHHIYNAVIGVGLNVNMQAKTDSQITQPWCDVAQIINTTPNRNKLAGLLLDQLLTTITSYQELGLEPFIEKWRKLDATYGKKITLITPREKFTGTALGIDEKGYYLLKTSDGETKTFASGEVSLRLSPKAELHKTNN